MNADHDIAFLALQCLLAVVQLVTLLLTRRVHGDTRKLVQSLNPPPLVIFEDEEDTPVERGKK